MPLKQRQEVGKKFIQLWCETCPILFGASFAPLQSGKFQGDFSSANSTTQQGKTMNNSNNIEQLALEAYRQKRDRIQAIDEDNIYGSIGFKSLPAC
ncbi:MULTISPECIES: hypothetical protein [unclassified Roseofilum]|uniref:hypothetical protein n=1 Tax=unclassified Roseofilum TaxID=2620099 RepID=UPI000E8E21E2|nr:MULTISPECIES: hypothetical protein [unclassified Roseofilum]MBP0007017.1 hypothetical protein [Roseofilum sp. Belize Diploria]MBP0035566.1 hypothetical protein [Roseofilum sp. Belize BBD 4]HBQ99737.1 hypothetical protein [Cyanobacteria bacterium UBA11691]